MQPSAGRGCCRVKLAPLTMPAAKRSEWQLRHLLDLDGQQAGCGKGCRWLQPSCAMQSCMADSARTCLACGGGVRVRATFGITLQHPLYGGVSQVVSVRAI
jgi:hypothetical protein